jgi:predicted lipoprotein with Yx(FWY)xxD motif
MVHQRASVRAALSVSVAPIRRGTPSQRPAKKLSVFLDQHAFELEDADGLVHRTFQRHRNASSSCNSRCAAAKGVSPGSTPPPGVAQKVMLGSTK